MLRISAVEDLIPDSRPSLFELSHRYQMTPTELAVFHRIYGLDRVPVWHSDVGEIVAAAVERLLKTSDVDPADVRWVVHAHTGTQASPVGTAMLNQLCHRYGLQDAQAFAMSTNNCASTVSALQVIDRLLLRSGPGARAILVTGDVAFTPILQVIPHSSVTGDAAVACLLGRDGPGHRVLTSRIDFFGQHAGCQWQDESANDEFEAEYAPRLARTMQLTLDQCGLSWRDIKLVLPHNVNVFSWKRVAAQAEIPLGLVYLDQVAETAHCFGADIFLNFAQAERDRGLQSGDLLMLVTVGLGAVFAAAIVEYEPIGSVL